MRVDKHGLLRTRRDKWAYVYWRFEISVLSVWHALTTWEGLSNVLRGRILRTVPLRSDVDTVSAPLAVAICDSIGVDSRDLEGLPSPYN